MEYIFYKKGYKYQLANEYSALIPIKPIEDIDTNYIDLSVSGFLVIKNGYAWDGPSGPTIDSPSFMRGLTGTRCSLSVVVSLQTQPV